jgi:hypothetical protein
MVFLLFYPNLVSNRLTPVTAASVSRPCHDFPLPQKIPDLDVETGTYSQNPPASPASRMDPPAGTGLAPWAGDVC